MIRQIDHIGIAVKGLESRLPFWADTLGLEVAHIETRLIFEHIPIRRLPLGEAL